MAKALVAVMNGDGSIPVYISKKNRVKDLGELSILDLTKGAIEDANSVELQSLAEVLDQCRDMITAKLKPQLVIEDATNV